MDKVGGIGTRGGGCGVVGDLNVDTADASPFVRKSFLSNHLSVLYALATGSGEIDFEEFAELMVKQLKQGSEQEVREAFKAYDTANKGYFTKDELLKLLMAVSHQSKDIKISKDEIEEVVKFLERSGRIDFDSKCVLKGNVT